MPRKKQPPTATELAAEAFENLDLKGRMARQPYQTLLVAAGVGYVLGGGLFTRATGGVLFAGARLGARVATLPVVQDRILAAVQSALQPSNEDL